MLVNFILNTFNFIFLNLLSILIFMIICIIFELKNIFFFIILIYSSNLYQNIHFWKFFSKLKNIKFIIKNT